MDVEFLWSENLTMKKLLYTSTLILSLFILNACKDNEEVIQPIAKLGTVQLTFDNVVGEQDLLLDSTVYTNMFFQEFTVAKFNYFISNIELLTKDNVYVPMLQDSSYFLIKEADPASLIANLNWVNEGEYIGMRFVIGVDSLRNTKPITERTGVLDISGYASDMYWTWNSGYIFVKLECHKPVKKGDPTPIVPYVYHIGGYGGMDGTPTINNLKTVSLAFPQPIVVSQARKSKVHLKADALKVISGYNDIDFEKYPTVMLTTFSTKIAQNYSAMFSVESVE